MVRGEIWWADLPAPKKSEPGYRRPVLIIQTDSFNRSKIKTIVCCIITTNIELAKAPGNILLEKLESHLPEKSVINISRIITIDKIFLTKYVSSLNKKIMARVETGLKLVLDLV